MTREEEIIGAEFATNPYFMSTDGSIVVGAHQLGFKHGVEYADAHPKNPWHKTSEELPKEDGKYLVLCGKKQYPTVTEYTASTRYWHILGYQSDVKYWIEIPELPKED